MFPSKTSHDSAKVVISLFVLFSVIVFFILMPFLATGWGAHPKTMLLPTSNGPSKTEVVKPYGLFDMKNANPKVVYKVSTRVIIWSIIYSETIFVPVILLGKYLYEPAQVKEWQQS